MTTEELIKITKEWVDNIPKCAGCEVVGRLIQELRVHIKQEEQMVNALESHLQQVKELQQELDKQQELFRDTLKRLGVK